MKIKLDAIEHAMVANAVRNTKLTIKQLKAKLENTYGLSLSADIQKAVGELGKRGDNPEL